LQRDGVIEALHGSGNRILAAPASPDGEVPATKDVAILSPEPIERLRPNFTLWIDQLRILCGAKGYRLHVLHGRQYFRTNPEPALHRLVRQQPHGCWIVVLAGQATQRWFEANRVPCVIAGTVHVGVDLPFCAQDHRAMSLDAAKRMLALGHRRIALLTRRTGLAVDVESELGFHEAAAAWNGSRCEPSICRHDDTVLGVCHHVRQLMRRTQPPTALLVTNAHYHLTVSGCLHQLGKRIPEDVSIVSRTDDPFLEYVLPTPARYATRPREMANGLLALIQPVLDVGRMQCHSVRIPPRFIPGESLARAS
jgi:DNA-binding LacI/PurR family transcriptional regulator